MTVASEIEMYVDGGARGNPGPAGGGFAIFAGGRLKVKGAIYFGVKTNNQAEYGALVMALKAAAKHFPGAEVTCFMDSELVVHQMRGDYKVKAVTIKPLFVQAQKLTAGFAAFSIRHIPREKNEIADALANRAMDRQV